MWIPRICAPEVLTDDLYGREVDMWSVGVITYVLLSGFPPFYSENIKDLFQQIMIAKYDFPAQYWDHVSENAKDFVRKLLVRNPQNRMSAAEALEHAWLREDEPFPKPVDPPPHPPVGIEHTFSVHTYHKPTWCENCNDFLWGPFRQGYQCKACHMDVHKKCVPKVPNNCVKK